MVHHEGSKFAKEIEQNDNGDAFRFFPSSCFFLESFVPSSFKPADDLIPLSIQLLFRLSSFRLLSC